MAKRRVLIVDDSRTAQIRLRKMLDVYDVEVDTVMSAEEALGYLSYKQPEIIFLDHHMEGMDGLAALKIIKSNPDTALIPVIMYTSEQGDVYVGQARALGALDIISKDIVQPSNLQQTMAGLNILPKDEEVETGEVDSGQEQKEAREEGRGQDEQAAAEQQSASANNHRRDLERMQEQVGRLFELQIAKVRQEIADSTKFLMRRLAREQQDKSQGQGNKTPTPAKKVEYVEFQQPPTPNRDYASATLILWVMLVTAIGFTGFHLYLNNKELVVLADQYEVLAQQNKQQQQQLLTVIRKLAEKPRPVPVNDNRILFDALGWAANIDTLIPFGEQALGDQRIYLLGELLSLLTAANFKGTIFLDIHAGNYCVIEGPSGQWLLPEPESNLDDCVFLTDRINDQEVDTEVSVGFLNYIHSTPILIEGDIQLEMSALGYSSPRVSYPPNSTGVSAGEWNEAARRNSRLAFSFVPD